MSQVRDIDKGYRELVRRLWPKGGPKISVGIHEADGAEEHGEGMRVIDIAQIHEFGLGNVPERSFIRAWFDENEARAKEALTRLCESVVAGKRTPDQAVEVFALWAVGEIQARIAKGIPPALSPVTVARKGSSVPLIDTGQLRSSISYEITNPNGNVKHGTSNAAKERAVKAKAALREQKKADRKAERDRARERKNVRRDVKKKIARKVKGVKKAAKNAVRKVKKALR